MCSFISEKFGFDSPANIHLTKKFRELPGQPSYIVNIYSEHIYIYRVVWLYSELFSYTRVVLEVRGIYL